jgi:hypothetical protein
MYRKASGLAVVLLFVFLGEPALAFHFHEQNYHAGPGTDAITVGDVNNDGKLDLLVADACGDKLCETPGKVTVLFGNGDGTFTEGKKYHSAEEGASIAIAATDFNGDGNLDVAVVNTAVNYLGDVSILLGNGDGSFGPPTAYEMPEVPEFIRAGDFNHDGKMDLAVTFNNPGAVGMLLGNGDGTFQSPVTYLVEDGPQDLAIADVNNDGNRDLIVTNECGHTSGCRQGTVSILLGNGDGTFQPQQSYFVGIFPLEVAVADFNRDGNPDLVLNLPCGTDQNCTSNGGVGVLLGNGDGTFQNVTTYIGTGTDTARVGVGFFNGGSNADVVALNYRDGDITVFKGNGHGTLQSGQTFAVKDNPISVVTSDFNRDGHDDIAVVNQYPGLGRVSVLINKR